MPSSAALAAYKEKEAVFNEDPLHDAEIPILLETARDVVEQVSARTTCFNEEREEMFPCFEEKELTISRVLGRGGFCVVNEVKAINLDPKCPAAKAEATRDDGKTLTEYEEAFTRKFVAGRSQRGGKDARYAIKRLSDACFSDNHRFLKGTIDLTLEAKFLAVLEHPHIIKMRGTSSVDPFKEGYFLVLDRLYDTLEQRIRIWKSKLRSSKGIIGKVTGGKKKQNKIDVERVGTAADLASAMKYMHDGNIIYRDLKPDNIGYDVRGEVKMFDYGLAKELRDDIKVSDGTYKLTGFTGSLRYMSPEVAKSKPYGLPADVFSFGILFWSMIATDTPFGTYSCKMHNELVIEKGYRPSCEKSWPRGWTRLMKACWSHNAGDRPTFAEICKTLSDELEMLGPSDGGVDERLDTSRRSTRDISISRRGSKSSRRSLGAKKSSENGVQQNGVTANGS